MITDAEKRRNVANIIRTIAGQVETGLLEKFNMKWEGVTSSHVEVHFQVAVPNLPVPKIRIR